MGLKNYYNEVFTEITFFEEKTLRYKVRLPILNLKMK